MGKMELPNHLKPETLAWCQKILADYQLESHHVKILIQAGETWDRIGQARERIEAEGPYFADRWGQPKKHPALDDERNNRVVFARLIRELNLSDEAPESRPPGLKYKWQEVIEMPYRKTNLRRGKLSGATEMHLLVGQCLIAFSCQVCSGNHNQSAAAGVAPYTVNADAKAVWERHRERLLAIWRDPAGRQPGSSGFNATGYAGAGRTGLPCWAELTFENAKLPKFDKAWPQDVKAQWRELKDR
jgi:hypothetical protein